MKLRHLMILLSVILLSFSGCTPKVVYIPAPIFEMKTEPPLLDLKGSGEMKRIAKDKWEVSHNIVLRVKSFEKSCYNRNADYVSTVEAINKFNESLESLND